MANKNNEIKKLLKIAKALAKRYRELTGKPLGITGEIGEYEAARLLKVKLEDARTTGFDAIRVVNGERQRLQIKTRCLLPGCKSSQRLGRIDLKKPCDKVLLVLLNEAFEATAIYECDYTRIKEELELPGSKARNDRGQLGVSKFKSLAGEPIWPKVRARRQ